MVQLIQQAKQKKIKSSFEQYIKQYEGWSDKDLQEYTEQRLFEEGYLKIINVNENGSVTTITSSTLFNHILIAIRYILNKKRPITVLDILYFIDNIDEDENVLKMSSITKKRYVINRYEEGDYERTRQLTDLIKKTYGKDYL